MSISNAMASGVAGLLANSTAVERISYNIANADTVGYRRSFAQMVTSGSLSAAGGTMATGVKTAITQTTGQDGGYSATNMTSNLAISGPGMFVVNSNIGANSTAPNVFSRVGSFEPDDSGFLRNAAGNYLMGFAYDQNGSLGNVDRASFADLQPVNVGTQTLAGSASSAMTLSGNLPSQETGQATPGDPFVTSAEFYTPLGEAQRLTFEWQPSTTKNSWTMTVTDGTNTFGSVDVAFNDSGAIAGSPASYSNVTSSAVAPASFSFDPATGQMTVSVDNGTTPQTMTVDIGAPGTFDGITQFSGDYTPMNIDVDGSQSGSLLRLEFDEFGDVWGIFDNGDRTQLYSIPLATFPNANGLVTTDNSTFSMSLDSGGFYLSRAGEGEAGTINSGGVESSNVDIASELTSLIQRQRAYSSNAKIITTADEMLDEMIRLKR
ncbi:flagellar hook protein [Oceanicola sp. 22II-s10i]|uniref:flagellar hook protein FlgE n=1 Tax=Oceanicola sp. 22II-s10i TaxID=1317116 RepID=UPI000B51FDBD|nr:flagellar hook-basal body complex protein [Oceanicola sp. 22II-s10i]OWU83191.1 flagellar hook protein [Oceanicola sp. 22II-s10i]